VYSAVGYAIEITKKYAIICENDVIKAFSFLRRFAMIRGTRCFPCEKTLAGGRAGINM